ncbi:MAG: hypothetical protein ACREMA_20880, partial [Longimicrobiales bacterium]
RLSNNLNLNQPSPGPTSIASRRPYFAVRPQLADVSYALSDGLSNYNAFQLTVDKRMSQGLGVLAAYTWGHIIENVGNDYGGGYTPPQDIRNRNADRGNAGFDTRHRMTVASLYHLPFGKGRHWLNRGGAASFLLGGWQTNGIVSLRSGFPFNITQGGDLNTGGPVRPDRIASGELDNPTRKLWFDPQAFRRVTCNIASRPDLCHFGSSGYNILEAPSQRNLDFSVFKNFPITETIKVQFRTEFINAFNTPYFGQPGGIGFTTNDSLVPDGTRMGEVRGLRTPMRILQFGLKLYF